MKSIKNVTLIDFQSHEKTKLTLHPNFVTVLGIGDSGKSSLVRALKFLYTGEWDVGFIRNGKSRSIVEVELHDGHVVRWTRGDVNQVVIRNPVGQEFTFSNFGKSPPPKLFEVLGSMPLKLGDETELWMHIAEQHDPIFLLKDSAPTRARVLGQLANVHYVDHAVRSLQTDTRGIRERVALLREQKERLAESTKRFTELDRWQGELASSKVQLKYLLSTQDLIELLGELGSRLVATSNRLGQFEQYRDELQKVDAHATVELQKIEKLIALRALLSKLQINIVRSEMINDYLQKVVVARDASVRTVAKIDRFLKVKSLVDAFQKVDSELGRKQNEVFLAGEAIADVTRKYTQGLLELKICPTCGSQVKEENVRKHLEGK